MILKVNDKLKFLEYFSGREDHFASQLNNYYKPCKRELDIHYLDKHINGLISCGVYVLQKDSKCNFLCIDVDIPKPELDQINFLNRKKKLLYLGKKIKKIRAVLIEELGFNAEEILIEDTGGRGYHIWVFFDESIDAEEVLKISYILKHFIDFDFEFFPKQARLGPNIKLGNCIKLPLGIHQKYNSRSNFINIKDSGISFIESMEDSFEYLKKIKKVSLKKIYKILNDNASIIPPTEKDIYFEETDYSEYKRIFYRNDLNFLFDKCSALKKLKNKAEKGISLSHSEAFHLSNILLSVENSEKFIVDLLKKSYRSNFSRSITQKELSIIKPLHPTSCKKLIDSGICERYCNKKIEEIDCDSFLKGCNPLSVNLSIVKEKKTFERIDLIDEVSKISNIYNSYFKLKKYHSEENVVFFDAFDFGYFEDRIEINCKHLSRLIKTDYEYPFTGFDIVNIPKKLNKDGILEYRPLSYCSIYDLVLIQSIFNVISPLIEKDFQDSSYGYRVDFENSNSESIFLDWREYYPKFRRKVLKSLYDSKNKYYICCDIEKYYDMINHSILIEKVRPYIDNKKIFGIVKDLIESYKSGIDESKGLPQGPAHSRILANLYLNDFDFEVSNFTNNYFRYVDDFILFFSSREEADKGLKKVIKLLSDLGLNLSESEDKKYEILKTEKVEVIIDKIDNLRYGLFEEFKYVRHFNEDQINDFYDSIVLSKMPTHCKDAILKINEQIPSILYLISKNSDIKHKIVEKLLLIVEYLIKNGWFYPKRLNYIFSELIDLLDENKKDLANFYKDLHSSHKIFFILELFKKFNEKGEFKSSISEILDKNLREDNIDPFLLGFSIAIFQKVNKCSVLLSELLLKNIFYNSNNFPLIKYMNNIDYFSLTERTKKNIRDKITEKDNFLVKKALLSKSNYINATYTDNAYLNNLLINEGYMLIPEITEVFISIYDNTDLFKKIIKYFKEQVDFKEIIVNYIIKLINEKINIPSLDELNNLEDLFKTIEDTEIRRELLNEISRLKNILLIEDSNRNLKLISKYNQCNFYEILEDENYEYREKIPIRKLEEESYGNLRSFKNVLEDLSFNGVVPNLEIEIDSKLKEIVINYKGTNSFINLKEFEVSLDENDSILFIFEVVSDLYKKANYYFDKFKKIPLIEIDKIIVDVEQRETRIIQIGQMFCPNFLLKEQRIWVSEKNNIPIMLSNLLVDLFFGNNKEKFKDFEHSSKIGLKLWLKLFIEKLKGRQQFRYSFTRFDRALDVIRNLDGFTDYKFTKSYFFERFDSLIFKRCYENIDWFNISETINDFYKEIAKIFEIINFSKLNFFYKAYTRKKPIHILTNYLLNINVNLKNILPDDYKDQHIKLFELLNYYGMLCIETISFLKHGINKTKFSKNYKALQSMLDINYVRTKKEGCELSSLDFEKIKELNEIVLKNNEGQNLLKNYSLKQIVGIFLINNFSYLVKDKQIIIEKFDSLKEEYCATLTKYLIKVIPDIDIKIIQLINGIIKNFNTPHKYLINEEIFKLKDQIMNCINDINYIRKKMRIKRFYGCNIEGCFPLEIMVKNKFKKIRNIDIYTINDIPLGNQYPASKSICSWDNFNGYIYNVVIPSIRVENLINKIRSSKKIWRKISYIGYLWICAILFTIFGFAVLLTQQIFIEKMNLYNFSNGLMYILFGIAGGAYLAVIMYYARRNIVRNRI